jgi:dienelactone hydrolase
MSTDYGSRGAVDVCIEDGEWLDAHRSRLIRWRHYRPQLGAAAPLIIYSHGLGGSRRSGEDWLAHWASWGIGALALQHPGTDEAAAGNSPLALRHLLRSATDKAQLASRQADLMFALEAAERQMAVSRFGIAGHSYGAVSALRLIGEQRGMDDAAADPRIAAAILFSPSARGGTTPMEHRFANVTLPCLHLTGSADDGIGPGDIDAADRCLPYRHSCSPGQLLLVLHGAGHLTFAGQGSGAADHLRLLAGASSAFWLSRLQGDPEAGKWLAEELPAQLAARDHLSLR